MIATVPPCPRAPSPLSGACSPPGALLFELVSLLWFGLIAWWLARPLALRRCRTLYREKAQDSIDNARWPAKRCCQRVLRVAMAEGRIADHLGQAALLAHLGPDGIAVVWICGIVPIADDQQQWR
jgi:hypothetical protein